jgi:hypothetical protein
MTLKLAGFLVSAVVFALPAWAGDRLQPPTSNGLAALEQLDVAQASRFIEQLYRRGVEVLEDHVELKGTFLPDNKGERWGYLSLKLYPKGKARSEEGVKAETWLGFSSKPEEDYLHFDFKLSKEPKPTLLPEDHI